MLAVRVTSRVLVFHRSILNPPLRYMQQYHSCCSLGDSTTSPLTMGSQLQDTPALRTNPKFIFFTDFDGTITTSDTTVLLIDKHGMGRERRMKLDQDVLAGRVHFRDAFLEMMNSITLPFEECMQILVETIEIDAGFKPFYAWARENNVPVVVLSSGIDLIIRALLDKHLGTEWDMQIVSNTIQPREEGKSINDKSGWVTCLRDESVFGHDKSVEIRKYSSLANPPTLFYAGDGVSDLSAARETDLLFAKAGTSEFYLLVLLPIEQVPANTNSKTADLVSYCEKENVPFVPFRDWTSITQMCVDIMSGKRTVLDAVGTSSIHFE